MKNNEKKIKENERSNGKDSRRKKKKRRV